MDEWMNCCVGSLPTILQIVKLNMILSAEHILVMKTAWSQFSVDDVCYTCIRHGCSSDIKRVLLVLLA